LSEKERAKKNEATDHAGGTGEHQPPSAPLQSSVISNEAAMAETAPSQIQRPTNDRSYKKAQIAFVKRQIRAAEKLNCITLWASVVGGIGLFIVGGTLLTTKMAADAAKTQARAALMAAETGKKQLELSERPWVFANQIEFASSFDFFKEGAIVDLRFNLTNIGHSPARDVSINMRALIWSLGQDPLLVQKQICDPLKRPKGSTGGLTIFPNQVLDQRLGVMFGRKELDAVRLPRPHYITPILAGCIDYGFEFKPGHHQTRFIYMIAEHPATAGNGAVIASDKILPLSRLASPDTLQDPIPAPMSQLELWRWSDAGFHAD
jgi:hypothetical protein